MKGAIVDFHAHILPQADHGSDSTQTSMRQLRNLASAGVGAVVATPHLYLHHDSIEKFLRRRERSARQLLQAIELQADKECLPEVYLGAEVLVFPGLEHIADPRKLCIQGTNVMLLEMPFFRWNTAIWETMRTIISWDEYVPILAHIDRYPQEDIARLLEMGYSAQINSAFFLRFGAKSFWKPLAENGILQAIGSDIHGRDVNSIARAYRKLGKYKETLSRRSRNLLQHATRLEDAVRLKKPSLTEEAAEKGKTSTAAEESK